MMGGGKGGAGASSPTAGSVKNGASRPPSGANPNTRVERKKFVNPDAGDPLEDVDDT